MAAPHSANLGARRDRLIDKRETLDLAEQTPLNPHVRLWLRSLGCVTRHVAGNRTGSIRGWHAHIACWRFAHPCSRLAKFLGRLFRYPPPTGRCSEAFDMPGRILRLRRSRGLRDEPPQSAA